MATDLINQAKCNACGKVGATTEEHLIHLATGRVMFADRTLDRDQLDSLLRSDRWAEFLCVNTAAGRVRPAALADAAVRNLLCEVCNRGWANELEKQAGEHLFRFIHEDGPAAAHLLRRWVWFLATKAWWLDKKTEPLRAGPLLSILETLARPHARVLTQVRVARLAVDPERWAFQLVVPLGIPTPEPPSMLLVLRGTAFFAVDRDNDHMNPLPFPTVELLPSIRLRRDVPTIPLRALSAVPGMKAVLDGLPA